MTDHGSVAQDFWSLENVIARAKRAQFGLEWDGFDLRCRRRLRQFLVHAAREHESENQDRAKLHGQPLTASFGVSAGTSDSAFSAGTSHRRMAILSAATSLPTRRNSVSLSARTALKSFMRLCLCGC